MLLVGLAVIAGILGLAVTIMTAGGDAPVVDVRTEARHGDLSTWVEAAEWLEHDHNATSDTDLGPDAQALGSNELESGFAMPASMMPGTPDEGYVRLQVELTMFNHAATTEVSPAGFVLEDADGRQWDALLGGTFNPTDLHDGHLLNTVVAFDISERDAGQTMYLTWRHAGSTTRFLISDGGHH